MKIYMQKIYRTRWMSKTRFIKFSIIVCKHAKMTILILLSLMKAMKMIKNKYIEIYKNKAAEITGIYNIIAIYALYIIT